MPRLSLEAQVEIGAVKRFCNRCNKKLETSIVDEIRCKRCGCPEFRWESLAKSSKKT